LVLASWPCLGKGSESPGTCLEEARMAALSLYEVLAELPDPRSRHGLRHPLCAMLGLVTLGLLMGRKSLEAIAQLGHDYGAPLAHALGFRRKTPSKSTLSRSLRRLGAEAVEAALSRWVTSRLPEGVEVFSLDGKTARGSRDGEVPAQHLVSAYAPHVEAVLGQITVDAKTNEHKAALELLGILPLRGKVVVGDALFCQRDVCQKVVDEGGDYVFLVKENQPSLGTDIAAGFGFEAAARSVAAAFSPWSPPAAPRAGRHDGGQGAWPAGEADLAADQHPDPARPLARLEAGLRVDA
jgi:DDE_Tnp_1-associated/Transposase DDE domain